jgi:hypothetical protein
MEAESKLNRRARRMKHDCLREILPSFGATLEQAKDGSKLVSATAATT